MKAQSKSRQKSAIFVGEDRSSKENKQLAVSIAILEIIESDGLLGVTHSKVARKSRVSRAWIYEYIGQEKTGLIEFGADVFAGYLSRVGLAQLPKTRTELETQLKEGIEFLFRSVEQNPLIIKLFFRFRGSPNPVGKVIQKYEKKWLKDASQTMVDVLKFPSAEATLLSELVLTLRLGFAHRIATSADIALAHQQALSTFSIIHSMILEAETAKQSGRSN